MEQIKRLSLTVMIFLLAVSLKAQTDTSSLLKELDAMDTARASFVEGTFKGTFIQNTASVESPAKGVLQVMIMHRFGKISDGAYDLFGLDNATIRLGLDYGITSRLAVSVGRSSFEKTYDGSLKYKVLRQTSNNSMPITLSLNAGITYITLKYDDKEYMDGTYRTRYFTQALIARKFSPAFSFQLTPTWLHYNLVPTREDENNIYALGGGGRIKLSKRISFNAEYTYLFPNQVNSTDVYNSLSGGIDIETGGHVFQLVFSNSVGTIPTNYIANTTDTWKDGGIYFGFNISRVFNITKTAKSTNAKKQKW